MSYFMTSVGKKPDFSGIPMVEALPIDQAQLYLRNIATDLVGNGNMDELHFIHDGETGTSHNFIANVELGIRMDGTFASTVLDKVIDVQFRIGTAAQILEKELKDAKIDLAILDPPRNGCEKLDLQALIHSKPERITYVSCNPTTLARDLFELGKSGYRLQRLAMVDMFPMTYHLEVVALCEKSERENKDYLHSSGGKMRVNIKLHIVSAVEMASSASF